MKRMLCAVALAAALTFAGGSGVMAHYITVDTPGAGEVRDHEELARGTPDHKSKDGSAASQGTNTACEAIPENSAVYIEGGTCHR